MNRFVNFNNLPEMFTIGRLEELIHGAASRRAIGYMVRNLLREGKVFKVTNSIFSKTANVFYIAYHLYKGYIGLSSALYIYGLKTEVEATVYVCTSSYERQKRILDRIVVPVNVSRQQYGTEIISVENEEILVSSYPKTIFDIISNPKFADYFGMYRALNQRKLTEDEWRELLYYTINSNLTDARRVGYATDGMAPEWFTKRLINISNESTGVSYFFKHRTNNYNLKWRLYDSLDIRRWLNAN